MVRDGRPPGACHRARELEDSLNSIGLVNKLGAARPIWSKVGRHRTSSR